MYSRHRIPDTAWAVMVAQAAPDTPILRTRIVKKSRATFTTDENTRKIRGVVLSPRERMVQDRRL